MDGLGRPRQADARAGLVVALGFQRVYVYEGVPFREEEAGEKRKGDRLNTARNGRRP